MLTENTVYLSKQIADALSEQGYALRPKPGEIVDVVATAPQHYSMYVTAPTAIVSEDGSVAEAFQGPSEYQELEAVIAASKALNAAGNCPHDLALEQQVALAGDAIAAIMDFSRNVVNPTIAEVVTKAQQRLGEVTEDALTPIDVVQDTYSDVWASPALDALISDFAGMPAKELTFPKFMPLSGDADVTSLIATGSADFDAEILEMLQHRGTGVIGETYEAYLSISGNAWADQNAIIPFNGDRDVIIVLFLLANHFNSVSEVPTDANISLEQYRLYFAQLRSEMARRVNAVIEQRERNRRSNRLIISYPAANLTQTRRNGQKAKIVVNTDLYGDWIRAGGEVEVLLGAYIGDNERSPEALIANADRYRAQWSATDRLLKMEARAAIVSRTVDAINWAISAYIAAAPVESLPPVPKADLQKRANEQVRMLTEKQLGDLYRAVRRVVCRTLFAHTDAESILGLIDTQVEANPGIEVRDAALLAVIDYVVDWLAKWIDVEKV
jgi:hypothetical protein